ncbi:alpha-amylase [Lentzea tibetensis]|nr:alpha-amylase family protein [Lentzea tibetensis]
MRILLTLAMTLSVLSVPAQAAPAGPRDVIVQLFEWNWKSVARECTSTLGPKGFGYAQVSPPQEHVTGPAWWTQYQPVSYRLESRLGTRAEFASMVSTCHSAGVKVLVDAVINHTTGGAGTGWAGSAYTHYDHPGTYASWDFHHCGRNGTDDIANYHDRWEVQNCELVNLADLATDTTYVRDRIAAYLNDLLSLGVDGFRVDAAKHMPAADIDAIKSRLSRPAYLVQEVIFGAGEPIGPAEYTGVGDVHEFRYGYDLKRVLYNEKLAYLRNFGEGWGYIGGSSAVVFVDNHDTQRNASTLSYKDGARYQLANTFMLAWPYGTPAVMSGYSFGDNDAGPPQDASGRVQDASCGAAWVCEHRSAAGMVGFHNAVRGTAVVNWWDDGGDVIAFGRGSSGFVVLNDTDGAIDRWFQTSLPAGMYCDVSGTGGCYSVNSAGWFRAVVPAHASVAIHR